ncbi:hypothetical protein ACFV4M_04180 [Kitasatospora indigofera]|uniref:hypothetical protein n=1 Tax=Kitasatospora indigofera TaxID=67307 RepID=UPI003648DB47
MTDTARTRLLATALDTADSAATVLAGAAAGLTTYRALAGRPVETRLTITAAAGALALCLADQARPLRASLGLPAYGYTATATTAQATAPTPEQLAADAEADAAHRAATHAHTLDHGSGSLTQADNWTGQADGSATCELTPDAHLLCLPAPSDRYGAGARTYYLAAASERPIEVHTLAELVALLDRTASASTPRRTTTRPSTTATTTTMARASRSTTATWTTRTTRTPRPAKSSSRAPTRRSRPSDTRCA